jgi:uncharacterized protein (TIGR00725 family)
MKNIRWQEHTDRKISPHMHSGGNGEGLIREVSHSTLCAMKYTLANKTVGVMGSGRKLDKPVETLAEQVGEVLADLKVNLLTGGGGGVMQAVSASFREAQTRKGQSEGIIIGILRPDGLDDRSIASLRSQRNYSDLCIRTHLPFSGDKGADTLSRNHINALTPDVIIALPGAGGTAGEVTLALRYGTPLIVFSPDRSAVSEFPEYPDHACEIEEVRTFIQKHL